MNILVPPIFLPSNIKCSSQVHGSLDLGLDCSFFFHWLGNVSLTLGLISGLSRTFDVYLAFTKKNIPFTVRKMELVKHFLLTCTLQDDLHLQHKALIPWHAAVVAGWDDPQSLAEVMWLPSSLISAVYCIRRKGQQIDLISVQHFHYGQQLYLKLFILFIF